MSQSEIFGQIFCFLDLHALLQRLVIFTIISGLPWGQSSHLYWKFRPESIKWFIENQALLPSDDLAPPPPGPSPVGKMSLFLSLPVCRRSSLLRAGRGDEPITNHMTARMLVLYKSFNTPWFRPSVHCTVYNVQRLFCLWFLSNKMHPFRASQHHVLNT